MEGKISSLFLVLQLFIFCYKIKLHFKKLAYFNFSGVKV